MLFYLCDDNENDLKKYKKELLTLADKYEIDLRVVTFDNGEKMLFHLEEEMESVDAIYLDINMPEMDGISVAEKLEDMDFPGELIFLTVSQEHFLSAFDVGAFNYIVKPESDMERFERVFYKVKSVISEKDKEYVLLTGGGQNLKVAIDDIEYFEVHKRIVTVYYKEGEFSFPSTIGKIENHLYAKGFVRLHRGYLVNMNMIRSFTYSEVILRNGSVIPIGRTYQSEVNWVLKEHIIEDSAI